MSDYMFMLESHLTRTQSKVVSQIVAAAHEAGLNIFLAGGAIRDMLGGFPVRDLDFVVEGQPVRLVKALIKAGVKEVSSDDLKKLTELRFPEGVTASVAMSRQEHYTKTGGKPQVKPAPIYDHLRSCDFTVNAIALSLNKGSRGLLIDPTNGVGDLETRELRTVSNYAFYDEPVRILRMIRLQIRLGLSIEAKTQNQYQNAREANVEKHISSAALHQELIHVAAEQNPGDVIAAWDREQLLVLFSPALTGAKINTAGFQKLQKAMQLIPYGVDLDLDPLGLFLNLLTEKMTPKDKSAFIQTTALTKTEQSLWKNLDARAKKLEKALGSEKVKKASQIYALLSTAPGDEILYLLCRSQQRLIQDRLKNYLQKYIVTAQEVTEADVVEKGGVPGTAKFETVRKSVIFGRLDGRIKKPAPPPEAPVQVVTARRFN